MEHPIDCIPVGTEVSTAKDGDKTKERTPMKVHLNVTAFEGNIKGPTATASTHFSPLIKKRIIRQVPLECTHQRQYQEGKCQSLLVPALPTQIAPSANKEGSSRMNESTVR